MSLQLGPYIDSSYDGALALWPLVCQFIIAAILDIFDICHFSSWNNFFVDFTFVYGFR
jgi:hypothetical protein